MPVRSRAVTAGQERPGPASAAPSRLGWVAALSAIAVLASSRLLSTLDDDAADADALDAAARAR